MTISYLPYNLLNGFVHNWLAAGPQVLPVGGIDGVPDATALKEVIRQLHVPDLEITGQPVIRGKLTDGTFNIGDYQGSWEFYTCQEDHLLNQSSSYPSHRYLRSWAYTELESQAELEVQLCLTSPGLADLWLNRTHILHKEMVDAVWPAPVIATVRLKRGPNHIFARFETLAAGRAAHFMALQVRLTDGEPLPSSSSGEGAAGVSVRLPTTILPRLFELRSHLEQLYAGVALEREVVEREQEVALCFPNAPYADEIVTIRVMDPAQIIFRDGVMDGKRGQRIPLNSGVELIAGRYQVELLPRVQEYYELNMRLKKDIPFWTVGNIAYSTGMYGTYQERRQEGLLKAVEQRNNLFADIARMALDWWSRVENKNILAVIAQVNQRVEGSVIQLAGLLGMLYRFAGHPSFPREVLQPLEACVLNYRYSRAEPGQDSQDFDSDSRQILFNTCELLAGQHYPERVFTNSGQIGQMHSQQGARLAQAWLMDRAAVGFADWGSSEELTGELIALSLLVDLSEDSQLQELAMVLMDKIFFSLALNTYQGILGAPQRRISSQDIYGGILQPTAGIARLMWGQGVFNHRIEGLVSLACMDHYDFPAMLAGIAAYLPEEMWAREQHAGGTRPANKVSYRTPDYMLSSLQDYLPGETGTREHVWQATLGPAATVFTTAPGCSHAEDGMAPGLFVGNARLPRVAQWKNALIAIYNLAAEDWMGFTHAYFPTAAFAEYSLREGWAFARKGDGYLALTASQGIELVGQGPQARKELRSPGRQSTWICQMGRAARDGDFAAFQDKILAQPVQWGQLSVTFKTLQGELLSFGYDRPFQVDQNEIPLSGFPHYENLYTQTPLKAEQMDIAYEGTILRLDFSAGSED